MSLKRQTVKAENLHCNQVAKVPGISSRRSPLVTGHDALHELIEHRNREVGVPMAGTPKHALADQLAAHGCQGLHLTVQHLRNCPRTMRPGAKVGHGAQVSSLGWSQPVDLTKEFASRRPWLVYRRNTSEVVSGSFRHVHTCLPHSCKVRVG